jgi:hypothetical protein
MRSTLTGVRGPCEYARGLVSGAPLRPLAGRPGGEPAYASAGRAAADCGRRFLAAYGFGARPVAGGTSDWLAGGVPVACGERENVGWA